MKKLLVGCALSALAASSAYAQSTGSIDFEAKEIVVTGTRVNGVDGVTIPQTARTKVVPVEVSVVRGMVYVQQGESSYRFDLRKPETAVDMVGQPGDAGWAVHFGRRGLDPFVVDASMVDAAEFVRQLREYRPAL